MTQEEKSELRSLLFNEHRIVDFSSDNPFVGIYFNDLIDIIDSMLKKDKEGDSKYETKSLEALATLKSILETEDADLIMTRYDQNRTMELTPDSVRDFFYGESTESDVVDLDLPSGTLWAKCNLGEEKETDFGLYYQWGDTEGYSGVDGHQFDWSDYKRKKCNDLDDKLILDNEDDPVFVATKGKFKTPTKEQFQELIDHTNHEWTTIDGVNGMKFINKNDDTKYIFIPAAGYCCNGSRGGVDSWGSVWSASRGEPYASNAWFMYFYAGNVGMSDSFRCYGFSVRGVINNKN